jgi:hypothetical protein
LLIAEQGLGDTIQFVRYAPLVKKLGSTVLVECQKPLLNLLATCPGVDERISKGTAVPAFDMYAPLSCLPRLFKTTLETIPANVPYLSADARLVSEWRGRLRCVEGFKIAIAWQGNPDYRADRERSIPLGQFSRLADLPGVRLISLQKGRGVEQLALVRERFDIIEFTNELDEQGGAFSDSAAILANLDLVITPDTSIAHLAGALGVPVWVALPYVPDWRWLLDRSDSPWYPTMRLFRQKKAGDWAGVFEEIRATLAARISQG